MGLLLLTLSVLIPCSNPAKPSRTGIPQTPTKPTIPSAKSSFAPPPTPTIPGTARTSEKAEVGADNVEADLHYPTGTPNVGMSNLQDSGGAHRRKGAHKGAQKTVTQGASVRGADDGPVATSGDRMQRAEPSPHSGAPGSSKPSGAPSGPPGSAPVMPKNVSVIPPVLDLRARPLCIPAVQSLQIVNQDETQDLHLFAVSTDTVHFHASAFKQTVLGAGQRASISVVFLPRLLGAVDGVLLIQTNVGSIHYQLHGEGIDNQYRVTPFLGAKVAVGTLFNPPIRVFNPYDTVLHIKEVFTNEGFLHLTLPQSTSSPNLGPAGLWEIAPRQTYTIINLSFMSQVPGKHQGFVHVKTDSDAMIIPVDIQVIKGGMYHTPDELDFGTLTSPSERHTLPVRMLNSGSSAVLLTDIYSSSPDSHLQIVFEKGLVLPAGVEIQVANVVYTGRTEGSFAGKLLLRTNDTNPTVARIELPYKARVMHGSLGYHKANASFMVSSPIQPLVQYLTLVNQFAVPLIVYSVQIPDANFHVIEFTPDVTVVPGGEGPLIGIRFEANSTDLRYQVWMELATNVTMLHIPLDCYHGRLTFESPAVDFGLLGVNEVRSVKWNLTNENPVPVQLLAYNSSVPGLTVRLDSVWNTNGYIMSGRELSARARIASPSAYGVAVGTASSTEPMLTLAPGHTPVFVIELFTMKEEQQTGEIVFTTPYETIAVTIKYKSLQGMLSFVPALLRFDPSFPGRILSKPISAMSTYSCPLHVSSITSADVRLQPVLTNSTLIPNTRMTIGYVLFDAAQGMTAGPLGSADGIADGTDRPPMAKLSHDRFVSLDDIKAVRRYESFWDEIGARGGANVHSSLSVNTDVVMGVSLAVRGSLTKPAIINDKSISFDMTQVGMTSSMWVQLFNPSDLPVFAQLLYIDDKKLAQLPPMLGSHTVKHARSFEIGDDALRGMWLQPQMQADLGPIHFTPSAAVMSSAVFGVRNNLSMLQTVFVDGEGGSGSLYFADHGVRLRELRFDLNSSHFPWTTARHGRGKDDRGGSKKRKDEVLGSGNIPAPPRDILFSRIFTAVNDGNLPVSVTSLSINGKGCKGNNFAVYFCKAFVLEPLESVEIAISFEPDFTSALVSDVLTVDSSLGRLSFPLTATMPFALLPICQATKAPSKFERMVLDICTEVALFAMLVILVVVVRELQWQPAGVPVRPTLVRGATVAPHRKSALKMAEGYLTATALSTPTTASPPGTPNSSKGSSRNDLRHLVDEPPDAVAPAPKDTPPARTKEKEQKELAIAKPPDKPDKPALHSAPTTPAEESRNRKDKKDKSAVEPSAKPEAEAPAAAKETKLKDSVAPKPRAEPGKVAMQNGIKAADGAVHADGKPVAVPPATAKQVKAKGAEKKQEQPQKTKHEVAAKAEPKPSDESKDEKRRADKHKQAKPSTADTTAALPQNGTPAVAAAGTTEGKGGKKGPQQSRMQMWTEPAATAGVAAKAAVQPQPQAQPSTAPAKTVDMRRAVSETSSQYSAFNAAQPLPMNPVSTPAGFGPANQTAAYSAFATTTSSTTSQPTPPPLQLPSAPTAPTAPTSTPPTSLASLPAQPQPRVRQESRMPFASGFPSGGQAAGFPGLHSWTTPASTPHGATWASTDPTSSFFAQAPSPLNQLWNSNATSPPNRQATVSAGTVGDTTGSPFDGAGSSLFSSFSMFGGPLADEPQ